FHSLMTAGYFRPQAASNSTNRAREASSVAHEHAHICDTAVLNLGEHVHPVLRALPAVPGPQPEDLANPLAGHGQSHVDRVVRHLTVADLHVDTVDEDRRVDRAVS